MKLLIALMIFCANSILHASPLNDKLDQFYSRYVKIIDYDKDGIYDDTRIDYRQLYRDNKRKTKVRNLISEISGLIESRDLSQSSYNEKLAFYINSYNFLILKTVTKYYRKFLLFRLPSVLLVKLSKKKNVFNSIYFNIAGEQFTFDTLENQKVRELSSIRDARIHFALNCASNGCPILLPQAYRAETLDSQLDIVTYKGLQLYRIHQYKNGQTYLSSIFKWFESDFIADAGSYEAFLKRHLGEDLEYSEPVFLKYNWFLNQKK